MAARGPSGPWSRNRLKPVVQDVFEQVGLPSKGDKQLLDHKTQERFYTTIVERYLAFCSDAGRGDELSRRLARVQITQPRSMPGNIHNQNQKVADLSVDNRDRESNKDLDALLMALRKLREGIVATKRIDDFSIQAYIFSIRLSILVKHWESYQPAMRHLLKTMHPVRPLSNTELQEFVGYSVLDLACRQRNLPMAFSMKTEYTLHDPKVDALLRAVAHDNYFLFWRVKRSVDGHKAKIIEFAEDAMQRQALKSIGKSYMSIDLPALESYTDSSWAYLLKQHQVGWQLDAGKVIIRKPKGS